MKENSTFIKTPIIRGFKEIEVLWPLIQKYNSMICGGYARYCLSQVRDPIPAHDIDIFPQTEESSNGLIKELKNIGFTVKHENDLAVTFANLPDEFNGTNIIELPDSFDAISIKTDEPHRWKCLPTIQVIKPVVEGSIVTTGTAEDVLNNFDFTITRAALISPEEGIVDSNFHEDISNNKLVIKNIHCPISSTLRVVKYCKKGFYIRHLEVLKLFLDWTERGIDYQRVLVDAIAKLDKENGEPATEDELNNLYHLLNVD